MIERCCIGIFSYFLLVACAYAYIAGETKLNAAHTKISGDHITIVCDHGTLNSVPPINPQGFNSTELQYCDLPSEQYELALERIGVQTKIDNLRIVGENTVLPNPDAFYGLTVRLPAHLETNENTIGGCSNIKQVIVMDWANQNIRSGFFQKCTSMTSLHLDSLGTTQYEDMNRMLNLVVPYSADGSVYNNTLQLLTVNRCAVSSLYPEYFTFMGNLRRLDLSHNNLNELYKIALLQLLHLEELDLSYNVLNNGSNIFEALQCVQETLKSLTLDFNNKLNICDLIPSSYDDLSALEHLSLKSVGTDYACPKRRAKSLRYLDLRGNNYTNIKFRYLPLTQQDSLLVDFRNNPIKSADFDEAAAIKHKNVRLEILTDDPIPIDCECDGYNIAKVKMAARFQCADGTEFQPNDYRTPKCDMLKDKCGKCECRRRSNNLVDAFCNFVAENKAFDINNLRSLHASYSHVNRIPDDLPDSLLNIDVSYSQIERLSEESLKAVFKVKERRIWLAGNPLVVDPRTASLLKENSNRVVDYKTLTFSIKDPAEDGISLTWIIILVLVLIAISAIIAFFVYRFYKSRSTKKKYEPEVLQTEQQLELVG